ncbi:collagen alpha-1(III) chain-like [Falco naumanni]|uniref:collagen alpha-1(III) chain-like n=1 Tax=Falco naumanni TaxID=148594 RepID=UPI001ADE89BF|nr:collagen alpha-1(III) chain-like [Falco naumanni]
MKDSYPKQLQKLSIISLLARNISPESGNRRERAPQPSTTRPRLPAVLAEPAQHSAKLGLPESTSPQRAGAAAAHAGGATRASAAACRGCGRPGPLRGAPRRSSRSKGVPSAARLTAVPPRANPLFPAARPGLGTAGRALRPGPPPLTGSPQAAAGPPPAAAPRDAGRRRPQAGAAAPSRTTWRPAPPPRRTGGPKGHRQLAGGRGGAGPGGEPCGAPPPPAGGTGCPLPGGCRQPAGTHLSPPGWWGGVPGRRAPAALPHPRPVRQPADTAGCRDSYHHCRKAPCRRH